MSGHSNSRMFPLTMASLVAAGVLSHTASAELLRIVVPNALEFVEGDRSIDVSHFGSFRQQPLYLTGEFDALSETQGTITGFYGRPNASVTQSSAATYNDITMRASTTIVSSLVVQNGDNNK